MDFHTHTPVSFDYANGAGPKKEELKAQTPGDWLQSHMAKGVDAVVVTDHNSTAFIKPLKDAYEAMDKAAPSFRPLVIFPGFELTVHGGLHLLAVFDPNEDLEVVSGLIQACGYEGDRGDSNGVTSKSFVDCVSIIKKHGLTIAAHVDEACGLLWSKLSTGTEVRARMYGDDISHDEAVARLVAEGKLAAGVHDETRNISITVTAILEAGLDAVEVRDWLKLPETTQEHALLGRLARVSGSDSHMPRDIGKKGFSMVHMTEANLEGLRMAFADGSAMKAKGTPGTFDSWSVRHVAKDDLTDWNRWPEHAVEKIAISHMKVAGRPQPLVMPLHPRLNVIVGGRGSGKSTFVHALRLATHREMELPRYEGDEAVRESPAGDFSRWSQIFDGGDGDGVLIRDGSLVSVRYRTPAQSVELSWNTKMLGRNADTSAVRLGELDAEPTEDGGVYSTSRFPLSIYSQKQVLEMSREAAGLMGIIDREKNIPAIEEELKQSIAGYSATKAKIRELKTSLEMEAKDKASLADIVTELEKIQSPEFKAHQLRQSQVRALIPGLTADSPLLKMAEGIKAYSDALDLTDLPAGLIAVDDPEGEQAEQLYKAARAQLKEVAVEIRDKAASVHAILVKLDEDLRASPWWKSCESAKAANDALLGTGATAFDPERIGKLFEARITLEEKLEKHRGVAEEIDRMETTAAEQLAAVVTARDAITGAREAFVTAHNLKDTLLRMKIVKMGADAANVERSLRGALGVDSEKFSASIGNAEGSREDSLMKLFSSAPSREEGARLVRERVIALLMAAENEQGFADLQNNLRRQLVGTPSRREAIETWFPEDRLVLQYRTVEANNWKSISQGSIGQQTAAVLSFLLSFGNEPLILDQPEDDLDTSMIMSLIVEKVRMMKERRQIIIVTHNPNIVVHGDADLVHAMRDVNGQMNREAGDSGGLQQTPTRRFICDVMEGGAVAFRKRFDRMGRSD